MTVPPYPDHDELLDWVVRSADPEFQDWTGLAAWLAEEPTRNAAYNALAAEVDDVLAAIAMTPELVAQSSAEVASFEASRSRRVPRWVLPAGGMALAASVAGLLLTSRPEKVVPLQVIDAPVGMSRTIAMRDGSHVTLAAGSRMMVDPSRARGVTMARGRGMFTVRHDADHPFRVAASGHQIVDAGTVFEVAMTPDGTEVAVREGLVVVDPALVALVVAPGQRALLRHGREPHLRTVPTRTIGRWREDRMSYVDAPLTQVAADLSVTWGWPVKIDPAVGARRYTGTLVPAALRDRPDDLAALLGVRVQDDRTGWELLPR